jgi:hypothetical protein
MVPVDEAGADAGFRERERDGNAAGHPRFSGHRGFRCTPRMAGGGGGFTKRDTVSCASAGRGAPGFPGDVGNGRRMEARQRAIRVFSGTPFPPERPPAHHSASPDAQSGKPSSRANPAGTPPAFSRAQASPNRASGVRGGRLQCACGRTSALGSGRGWRDSISPKTRMAPCRPSIPLPFPAPPRTCGATPARRRALTPFHCIAHHFAPGERDAQFATRSAINRLGVIVDFVARHTHGGKQCGFTKRDTVSCASAGAGRTGLPWGRRERQVDGSPAEGHPRFFQEHLHRRSAPQPTIPASPDVRSGEPSSRANPCGNTPGLLAGPGFARSRIGCSWRPAPVRLRQGIDARRRTRMAG